VRALTISSGYRFILFEYGSMRILIVEDDRRLAHQLKKGMEELGYAVAIASEGTEGLEAAKRGEFDVLVLDVMLPGLGGFSIVRRLRAAKCVTPILLLTARDAADDVVTGLDAGRRRLPHETVLVQDSVGKTPGAFQTQECGTEHEVAVERLGS